MRSTDDVIAYENSGIFELNGKAEPGELGRAVVVIGLRRATTRSLVLEAWEIFERLHARLWLERLHRVDEREGATP